MRKKSGKRAAKAFKDGLSEIGQFLDAVAKTGLSAAQVTWAYDYSIIRLYREFEDLVLHCLIAAINSDTEQLSKRTGIAFPKHLTDEVCEYIIVGDGYFDFRGRDGLIKTLKKFLPEDHYLVTIMKKPSYKNDLERLSALRNFAAHDSTSSRRQALSAIGGQYLSASGAWLKRQGRFAGLAGHLAQLADEIANHAPY